jgi:hypothetical protein
MSGSAGFAYRGVGVLAWTLFTLAWALVAVFLLVVLAVPFWAVSALLGRDERRSETRSTWGSVRTRDPVATQ